MAARTAHLLHGLHEGLGVCGKLEGGHSHSSEREEVSKGADGKVAARPAESALRLWGTAVSTVSTHIPRK